MSHEHREYHAPRESFWRSRTAWALLGFIAIGGFFLVTEHRAHLLGWLPFILLAFCPLLHIFGHGGHDHSRNKEDKS